MKRFIKHIILFSIPVILAIGILFTIRVDKKFSYNFVKGECENKASWIYQRIAEDERNIDIAFSGASQTACAIMDELVENEINKHSQEKLSVANMGYCRRGRDLQYLMLKELFKHKTLQYLIIEVAEDEPKKSHPVFPYLSNTKDLWGSCIFFNQRFPEAIWKATAMRFEYLKSIVFQPHFSTDNSDNKYGYRGSTQTVAPEIVSNNSLTWQKRLSRSKSKLIRKMELNYSMHYLEKIVQLAEANNCKVSFLYLPESGSGLEQPLLAKYYKSLSELHILPDSIINDQLNWKDATHFNDSGASLVSKFISSVLVNRMDE